MNNEKPWFTSKTIWSSLIAVAAALLTLIGIDIDESSQAVLTNSALQIVSVIASLTAIAARFSATNIIH